MNGDSPIPKMPTDVFTRMQSWFFHEGGYRETVNHPVYYLRVETGDDPGTVRWGLESSTGWDTTYAKMMVSSEDNTTLQDCDLGQGGFVFTDSGSQEYYLHSNDGTPGAYLAAV